MTVRLVGDRIVRTPDLSDWTLHTFDADDGTAAGVTDEFGEAVGVLEPGNCADGDTVWLAGVAGDDMPTWAFTPEAARVLARVLLARADEIEKGEG